MSKFEELKEKLEDKGIEVGWYLMGKGFQIWVHNPIQPFWSDYYKRINEEIIEQALIEIDYLKHR
jgi:hypothetical protein